MLSGRCPLVVPTKRVHDFVMAANRDVQDTGVGIPRENLERVFEAFFTTRSTIGTGIGLFVAKQFVEGHGGSIRVESSTAWENHGTTLEIFLPVHTSHEP